MSEMLWKTGESSQLRQFAIEQDAKFSRAMRQEFVAMAVDRGLKIIPKASPVPTKRLERRPRDVITIWPTHPRTDPQVIIKEVCKKHRLAKSELLSSRRAVPLVAARHEAMYRMSTETSMSLPMIGRQLGCRDHTTVLHGIRKYTAKLAAGTQ